MKALIYARQSSGKDDFSESVEAQIANCKKLAEKEKLEVIGIYKDLNTSGETYPVGAEEIARLDKAYMNWSLTQSTKKDFRLGLSQVLLKLSEVDVILVNELTRLYRPINGSFLEGHINQLLKENNVKVLQVQGGTIDLTKFDQQLITLIKNQILYEDLQKKRQNSINAFRIKKDSGRLCSDAKMYGIRYLGNGKIEVIPEWVEIIRFVYDNICASSAVCEKLASNDDFEIVVRQIENLEAHIFKISVSICLSKHCPYLVIETFHRGIGHVPETPESQDPVPIL